MRNVSFKINLIGDIIGKLKQIKAGFSKVTEEARKATGQTTKLQSVCDKLNMTNLNATLDVFDKLGSHIESATEASMSFGQVAMSIEATSNLIRKVNGHIKELASSYNTFDTAMRSVNTMMGLSEDGFLQMRESISNLSKEIPNGLERCHGEKEYMRMKSILYTHYIIIIISTYKT